MHLQERDLISKLKSFAEQVHIKPILLHPSRYFVRFFTPTVAALRCIAKKKKQKQKQVH
jgi:hypothetical protein